MPLKIQGQRLQASDATDATALPRRQAPGRDPFEIGHLPKRWDFDDTVGAFLPSLSTITFSAGVQGAKARRAGPDGRPRLDVSAVRDHFRSKGGVLIDPSDPRLGDFRNYQQRVQNDAGAEINFSIFESFDVIGQDVWWDHNSTEMRRFKLLLIESGLIGKIHPRVRQHRIEMQERDVKELQKRFGNSPSHDGLRTELEHAIGRLRAMVDGVPVLQALVTIKAERSNEQDDAPTPIAAKGVRTVEAELLEARGYLEELEASHAVLYRKVMGRKRPAVASLERVRSYIASVEDAIDEAEAPTKASA